MLPAPHRVDQEELVEEFDGFVVGEDLADFGDEDGPGDTTEVPHTVGADASVFGPHFHQSQGFLEVLDLFPRQLQNHQIILPTQDRRLTPLISYRLHQIIRNNPLNIPRHRLLIQLTKTDINIGLSIIKGDDRHFGVDDF